MKIRILMLFLFICCFSCKNTSEETIEKEKRELKNQMAFDKTKWKTKDGMDYAYRNKMLPYLMSNDTLKRLKKDGVIDLLGQPDRIDNEYLFYTIVQERIQFFPLHTKTLVIKLSNDGTVKSVINTLF
jgi:hypothetical protein